MADHALRYLARTLTADGRVWLQTPADLSTRFPEIELSDPLSGEVVHRLMPEEFPEVAAQLGGNRQVDYEGRSYSWHTRSALSDIQDYKERGEVVECALIEAPPGCRVAAIIQLLPILREEGELGMEPGDMVILRGGTDEVPAQPVLIPFSLPESLWPLDSEGMPVRPPLTLVCERDVTRRGMPPNMPVVRVDYILGWETVVADEPYRHVIAVI